jgi:S-(hydroxymethyl)glutathione dehydrogenase/alcohol dehydrogenase
MKAAVLRKVNEPLTIEDIEISKPAAHEVLIRTVATGVCHSDLHFVTGDYPHPLPVVLGHESAGIVEAVGSAVTYVEPGDHVVTVLSAFCGRCDYCLSGHMAICHSVNRNETRRGPEEAPRLSRKGETLHQIFNVGSYAEQMLLHENALAKIRPDMPLDRAALLGCAVITGVGSVFHTAKVEPGSTVAIIGCGGVGLSCVNGAALAGAARIVAIDREPEKLDLARKFGATDVVNAGAGDAIKAVRELTGGGVHYSFEAIGLKATAEQAFKMLRPGGTATVIGLVPVGVNIEIHGVELLQQKRIQGSNMGSNRFRIDIPRFVDFYMQGRLKLDALISDRIALKDINGALANLKTGKGSVARQVIMFD